MLGTEKFRLVSGPCRVVGRDALSPNSCAAATADEETTGIDIRRSPPNWEALSRLICGIGCFAIVLWWNQRTLSKPWSGTSWANEVRDPKDLLRGCWWTWINILFSSLSWVLLHCATAFLYRSLSIAASSAKCLRFSLLRAFHLADISLDRLKNPSLRFARTIFSRSDLKNKLYAERGGFGLPSLLPTLLHCVIMISSWRSFSWFSPEVPLEDELRERSISKTLLGEGDMEWFLHWYSRTRSGFFQQNAWLAFLSWCVGVISEPRCICSHEIGK